MPLQPYEWKDRPSLIETLFPVQKLSAESFKEQMANLGKTLTTLGSYWKGRKPLVLNKACILGALLPSTNDNLKDLQVFEMLMGMDDQSMVKRLEASLPKSRIDEAGQWLIEPYTQQVRKAKRPEDLSDSLYDHIWSTVNAHLGTEVFSFSELVEQLGIARFGHRPRFADVFCGSGQIPFEAARLGCDVYSSDLNPIACMLTWGSFNIVGAPESTRKSIMLAQQKLIEKVNRKIDQLGFESDENGWNAKSYLYCMECLCPKTGWTVPLLPTLIISKPSKVIAELIPIPEDKRYEITIKYVSTNYEIEEASAGTVQNGHLVHSPDGINVFRTNIKTIRGDFSEGKENRNRLRMWEKTDFTPRSDDIFQERLYCIHWMRDKSVGSGTDSEFRSVTKGDLDREHAVISYVGDHLSDWQEKGYLPDMMIEKGDETERLYRERGWAYWHQLFNPRQLLQFALMMMFNNESHQSELALFILRALNWNSKLCIWNTFWDKNEQTFYNQALNTIMNYGCRGSRFLQEAVLVNPKSFPLNNDLQLKINSHPATEISYEADFFVTDPPYGDAVKYEEITEFFIAWLRKNPPKEFADWTWDSRRALAIKGEDEGFRQGMIASYRKMAELMPDNGIQILMFTHQSGTIWADMTNIIWASGLQVTAAWYLVTETDSGLRQGANVTGTVVLVLRKRYKRMETFRDDLAWEIEVSVKEQVELMTGLDGKIRDQRSEGLYTDADLQMAGYAAALKVLTSYSIIDGKDMIVEAEAPRQKGRKTFVDQMIDFAVQTAVQFLVPVGFEKSEWQKLSTVERYYLKMAEMEHQGNKTLDNYMNFAKAFKVHHYEHLMSDNSKANSARLKLGSEFKTSMMSGDTELANTMLRSLLYAIYEVSKEIDVNDAIMHLMENVPTYMQNRLLLSKMAGYLAEKREILKPTKSFRPDLEASSARILAEAIINQRL